MKRALLALAILSAVPVAAAQAQIVIQTPPILGRAPAYPEGYWRGNGDEWRRREEYREAEHRRADWQHAHCVRDYRGQEFCRR